jgi:phage-related protein
MADPFPFAAMISQTSTGSRSYPTLIAQFADNRYSQRVRDGTAPVARKYDWTFENIPHASFVALMAFFDEVGKVDPFSWTPPGESIGNFTVENEPSVTYPSGTHYTVRVSVKENFDA